MTKPRANKLRTAMKRARVSENALAHHMGITQSTLNRLVRKGGRGCSADLAYKLTQALPGLALRDLVKDTKQVEPYAAS